VKSALNGFAAMSVINDASYIGGIDGTVYKIHVSSSAEPSVDQFSMSFSNISLGKPCHTEIIIDDGGATAICFSNVENTIYFINVLTASVLREHSFGETDFISNIVKLGNDKVCYVHNNSLFKANVKEGRTLIGSIQNCDYPTLILSENHYIILNCAESTTEVYVPLEWSRSTDTFGIRKGAWKNGNQIIRLHPCHGTGFATLVYSRQTDSVVTFYNIYNDFEHSVLLNGTPNETLTCILEEKYLKLIAKDGSCDCWMVHVLDEDFNYFAFFPIPHSNGDLLPVVINNETINQDVLIFQEYGHVKYVIIPSTKQVLYNVATNTSLSNITDDVILYHELARVRPSNTDNKQQSTSSPTENGNWRIYVGVAIPVAVILTILIIHVIAGINIVEYRKRHGW